MLRGAHCIRKSVSATDSRELPMKGCGAVTVIQMWHRVGGMSAIPAANQTLAFTPARLILRSKRRATSSDGAKIATSGRSRHESIFCSWPGTLGCVASCCSITRCSKCASMMFFNVTIFCESEETSKMLRPEHIASRSRRAIATLVTKRACSHASR